MIIGIDFDGTCVEHDYPRMGQDVPGAVETLGELIAAGHSLILWTMRSGLSLEAAKDWFADKELPLFGANKNPEQDWSSSPKVYCHLYIDDAAFGCPMTLGAHGERGMVDWFAVKRGLAMRGVLPIEGWDQ